ncbi:MAG: peptidoglycan DD-metalloendopeptidase family protein [Lachnospiraceae bacterium]|nr:peptidoglycan DD-metalloendopeptidase family protein [Lachnospiraceae bacterium]
MQKKRKRISKSYFFIVSDDPNKPVILRRLRKGSVNFWRVIALIFISALVVFAAYTNYRHEVILVREQALKETIEELKAENASLKSDNESMLDKINILSETVNQKKEIEKEVESKMLPTGFPLSGAADVKDKDEELRIDGELVLRPLLEFVVADGIYVIASGDGVVSNVSEEVTYGYEVRIDHGNGYVSVYRTDSEPKVKTGDQVSRGGLIYEIECDDDDTAKFAYQIIYNEEYIDPNDMLEING